MTTKQYNNEDMEFQYPANWTLESDENSDFGTTATVIGPHGGFWTVIVRPLVEDLNEMVDEVIEGFKLEYGELELELESIESPLPQFPCLGMEARFWVQHYTVTSWVLCFPSADRSYVVFFQAEDREFEESKAVFLSMTLSLLKED